MNLIDNKKHGKIYDALKESFNEGCSASIISSIFSIYAFDALKKELSNISELRFLFSEYNKSDVNLLGNDNERKFRNQLDCQQIAIECAKWIEEKVFIKKSNHIGQSLTHIKNPELDIAIQGSSNFNMEGLGLADSTHYQMNTKFDSKTGASELLQWFNTIWEDENSVEDIKKEILTHLSYIYSEKSSSQFYYYTIYSLFKEFIEDIQEDKIIKTKTGFKDSTVWNKLFHFQKDGVLGAIQKLEKHNGCIIADSVGLGKTFSALAVIKYYELRNDRVLVLCPKKLRDNWTLYTVNDKRNLLAPDRLNYDVLNHTDLTRFKGKSGEINLETLSWGNYDLIVIDESHNFRNNPPRKDGVTRYSRLMNEVIKSGVKTKVLLLSATPVNNKMNDLKNQIAFMTEGVDSKLIDSGIPSIEQALRRAQSKFNEWLKLEENSRNIETLLEMMNFEYFKLLDLLTIARSRKHIEKYYDITAIGKFPKRLKPLNIKSDIDNKNDFPALKDVNKLIKKLNLSAYSPLKYVKLEKREEYNQKYDITVKDGSSIFKQLDREKSLIHLIRVNLLKRMESSINSFTLTLEKLLGSINLLLEKLEESEDREIDELNISEIEVDSGEYDDFLIGTKVKVLIKDIDAVKWRQELEEDKDKLEQLHIASKEIDESRDAKLFDLKNIITNKIKKPINAGNKKIIIFTAFADTASYIYNAVSLWAKNELNVNSAIIIGSGSNQTTMENCDKDLGSLLTAFSPTSKERNLINPDQKDEIDILIATDCISEGQNLQDCDYLINYDIHWNPVRIIQRFGRVDRIGSTNDVIQLVNFWPNIELDEYINLESRVSGRMVLLDISATGEENVIDQNSNKGMNDLEYRKKQLKQLQDSVVDLEDISGGVSITDLTLNDFRMDLSEYLKEHSTFLNETPVVCSVSKLEDNIPEGVLFCLKDTQNKILTDNNYSLAPYFLVYVSIESEIVFSYTQMKKSLDLAKKHRTVQTSMTINSPKIKKINSTDLLEVAISSIQGKSDEKGVESLFSRGGTILSENEYRGIENFEVISWQYFLKEGENA
jgi:ERCC4-related helicase